MNIKSLLPRLLYVVSAVFIVMQFFAPLPPINQIEIDSEKVNLALRQTAHQIYLIDGDSSSLIPPVTNIEPHNYNVTLDKKLNYDTLPYLLDIALKDYNLPSKYQVAVKSCENQEILLGYNFVAFNNQQLPCTGRDHISECNIINLKFYQESKPNHLYAYLSILTLLLGLTAHYFTRKKISQFNVEFNPNESPTNKITEEVLKVGHTSFSPANLILSISRLDKELTYREGKLLELFFRNPNQVLKRETIHAKVWEDEGVIVGRSVDVFVSRLRKILAEDETIQIKNVHGVGYRLEVSTEKQ